MNYVKLIPRFVIRQSDYLKIRGQNYKKSSISPKENRQKLQFCLFYSKRLCDAGRGADTEAPGLPLRGVSADIFLWVEQCRWLPFLAFAEDVGVGAGAVERDVTQWQIPTLGQFQVFAKRPGRFNYELCHTPKVPRTKI